MVLKTIINGTAAANSLIGTNGADAINGLGGNDFIYALDGDDFVYGGIGNDQLHGDTGNDRVYGGAGNDWLTGDEGNDVLIGGAGSNFLQGGNGNDTMLAGSGADVFNGDDGIDTASFVGHSAIRVALGEGGAAANVFSNTQPVVVLHDVENVIGSGFADIITGNSGNNRLAGGAGLDLLFGGDGADALFGDNGTDFLTGGAGADTLTGGLGLDVFDVMRADVSDRSGTSLGRDLITDFKLADRLNFAGFDLDDPDFTVASRVIATNSAAGTTISVHLFEAGADIGTVEVALLAGVHYASINAMIAAGVIL